jgi:uncharacterized integral membrane protein
MKPRSVLYMVALLLIGVFTLANWGLLTGPAELNPLIARIQAPLGVLIVLICGVLILVDLSVHALSQRAWTRERRTLAKDLDGLRLRAERDEESRTGALRAAMERELAAIRGQLDQLIAGQTTLHAQRPADPKRAA